MRNMGEQKDTVYRCWHCFMRVVQLLFLSSGEDFDINCTYTHMDLRERRSKYNWSRRKASDQEGLRGRESINNVKSI